MFIRPDLYVIPINSIKLRARREISVVIRMSPGFNRGISLPSFRSDNRFPLEIVSLIQMSVLILF